MGLVLAAILLVFILILVGLLFIPINIYVDTRRNLYYAELKGLARASIEPDKIEVIRIRLKIPFKVFYFFPLKAWNSLKKKKKRKTEKGSKNRNRFTPKTILRLIRSFRVKEWKLDLDTGDCITNAKLYPLFALLNYRFGGFNINYEGRNHALLLLRNRPISMIKLFINP